MLRILLFLSGCCLKTSVLNNSNVIPQVRGMALTSLKKKEYGYPEVVERTGIP
jgi:hypothetical protein